VPDLELQLTELAAALEWPSTPRLKVVLPIHGDLAREARRWSWWKLPSPWGRPLAVAVAAVLVVAIALVAYPPSRNAIADWVNLHVLIHPVRTLPSPSTLPTSMLGSDLDLGLPTTLEDARHQVGWKVTVPSDLGRPDAVYVRRRPPTEGQVSLVYSTAPGIPVSGLTGVSVLISEARGSVNEAYFEKLVAQGTTIEDVSVGGRQGYWISGAPHAFIFTDASGEPFFDRFRLATSTLIFDRGDGTIVRIEADTTKERAIQIALSM
jgi:hypothetical protein